MRCGWVAIFSLALFAATPALAQTPIIEGGLLTGATGVDVGGTLYDVSFRDGTCAIAFDGCEQADFAFSTLGQSQVAAQALLDQVFLDGPDGEFDIDPFLTAGCFSSACTIRIPYARTALAVSSGTAFNANNEFGDSVGELGTFISFDLSEDRSGLWAVFTPSAAAVPEPSTWGMMLLGFGAIGLARRTARGRINDRVLPQL